MKDRQVLWLWLAQRCGVAAKSLEGLFECPGFEDIGDLYAAGPDTLARLRDYGVSEELLMLLGDKSTVREESIWKWCVRNEIEILPRDHALYPKSLRTLRDAPVLLYCRGRMPDLNFQLAIAAVGTRKMTDYGKLVSYEMGRGLAAGGAVLVSGMALGIDGMAMSGALDAGGTTVAVLGCGIDRIYPQDHAALFRRILDKGAVITEYPPGTPPAGKHFPVRNRLISGISQGVVVIEADEKSGALITAKHAAAQARDVFAVPGRIKTENSSGVNHLIQEGAYAVTCAEDILKRYAFLYPHAVNLEAARVFGNTTPDEAEAGAKRNHIGSSQKSEIRPAASFYGAGLYGGKTSDYRKHQERTEQTAIVPKGSAADIPIQNDRGFSAPTPDADSTEHFDIDPALLEQHVRYVPLDHTGPAPVQEKKPAVSERKQEPASAIKSSSPPSGDLAMLSETEREILGIMPDGEPVTIEWFMEKGYLASSAMAAMTMLEICGFVKSGAGGTYSKRGG